MQVEFRRLNAQKESGHGFDVDCWWEDESSFVEVFVLDAHGQVIPFFVDFETR